MLKERNSKKWKMNKKRNQKPLLGTNEKRKLRRKINCDEKMRTKKN